VQAENADLTKRLTGAHESLAQAQLDLGEARDDLQHTRDSAAALEQRWDLCLAVGKSSPMLVYCYQGPDQTAAHQLEHQGLWRRLQSHVMAMQQATACKLPT
jgi:hypothetical protein